MLLVKFFLFNLFLLMKMKHSKNKIIILITLLLSDIGLKKYYFAALSIHICPL